MIGFFGMPGLIELLIVAFLVLVPLAVVLVVLLLNKRGDGGEHSIDPNLAPCPDCGQQVSIYAGTCPHCGRPLR